ncbi:MAG: glutamate--tRNA ligase, partial [Bacteroidota bacterium]
PKTVRKKWKPERLPLFETLRTQLRELGTATPEAVKSSVVAFMEANELGFGDVLPILRVGVTGTMKGPDIFAVMALLGSEVVDIRLARAFEVFGEMKAG